MSLTGIKSRAQLSGTLASVGPWASLFGRASFRVYPYQLGAMVRSASTGTTVLTDGLGDFNQSDYLIVCSPTAYGDSVLFTPNLSKITRVTSDPAAAVDDSITISPAVAVSDGDYLLNLGADTALAPLVAPSYDGSRCTLYTDPVGNVANVLDYLLTGDNGHFFGWVGQSSGGSVLNSFQAVDLLVTDSSGSPQLVLPNYAVGPIIPAQGITGGTFITNITGQAMQGTINNAIAAAAAAGGGIVELGPGTFSTSGAIVPASGVWLRGSGMGRTVIQPSLAGPAFAVISYTAASALSYVKISDLTVDGNGSAAAAATGAGISLSNTSQLNITDVEVRNVLGHGIAVIAVNGDISDVWITNCRVSTVANTTTTDGGYGIYCSAAVTRTLTGVEIKGCNLSTIGSASSAVTADGVRFLGTGTHTRISIHDNKVVACYGAGIKTAGAVGSYNEIDIHDNYVFDVGKGANTEGAGIQCHVASTKLHITNNVVDGVGAGGGNGVEALVVNAGGVPLTEEVLIRGNRVLNIAATALAAQAIVVFQADNSVVSENVIRNCVTGGILIDNSTTSIIAGNVVVADNTIEAVNTTALNEAMHNGITVKGLKTYTVTGNTVRNVGNGVTTAAHSVGIAVAAAGGPYAGKEDAYYSVIANNAVSGTSGRGIALAAVINVSNGKALTGTPTLTFAADGTCTRSSGDWVAEGFIIGDRVLFANGAGLNNNVTGTIVNLSTTVMTISIPFTAEATTGYTVRGSQNYGYATVSGNSIGATLRDGILLSGVTNVTVTGNSSVNNTRDGLILDAASTGAPPLANIVIANNIFRGSTSFYGLELTATTVCKNLTIIGNDCSENISYGINLAGDITNGLIANNNCRDSIGGSGIIVSGTSTSLNVNGNVCTGNGGGLMTGSPNLAFTTTTVTRSAGNWITDNFRVGNSVQFAKGGGANNGITGTITSIGPTVLTCSAAPFTIEGSTSGYAAKSDAGDGMRLVATSLIDCSITGNICNNNSKSGLVTQNVTRSLISDNICEANNRSGMRLINPSQTSVKDNLIRNNGLGLLSATDRDGLVLDNSSGTVTDCILEDNQFLDNVQAASFAIRVITGGTATRLTIGVNNVFAGNTGNLTGASFAQVSDPLADSISVSSVYYEDDRVSYENEGVWYQ